MATTTGAVSPGVVDSGAGDRLGDAKIEFFRQTAEPNPARWVDRATDIAASARGVLTNPFVTGTIFPVDGGGRARLKRWVNDPLHGPDRFL